MINQKSVSLRMKVDIPVYDIQSLKSYRNDGILVSRFGYYQKEHQHLHHAHRHSFYHLVFFTKGSGTHQIDFKKFPVKAGMIYFMIPAQVHSWNFEIEPDGYILNFSSNYLHNFLHKPDYLENFNFFKGTPETQVIELPTYAQEKISLIFEDILKEGLHEYPIQDDLVKTLLIRLFIEVNRTQNNIQRDAGNAYNHRIIKNFKDLIELNYARLRLPKQYADLLYITPNHLNALCNDFLNVSAGTLIRDRVILEAKRLLINLDLRVSEIAGKLNFDDQSYFIKFFKKQEGITPEKFRKLNTTKNDD